MALVATVGAFISTKSRHWRSRDCASTLAHPELIGEFVDAYNSERKRLKKEASTERNWIERRLGEIEREIKRIVDFIVKGMATDALIPRMMNWKPSARRLPRGLRRPRKPTT